MTAMPLPRLFPHQTRNHRGSSGPHFPPTVKHFSFAPHLAPPFLSDQPTCRSYVSDRAPRRHRLTYYLCLSPRPPAMKPTFFELSTNDSSPYLSLVPVGRTNLINASRRFRNLVLFSETEMRVTPVATGLFQADLTPSSDDILIAILSLMLLFCLQGTVTSLLLRVAPGNRVSNHAFSLTQFLHLARDFRVRYLFTGRGPVARRIPMNSRLAIVAIALLVTTFTTEFLILFFTSPENLPVTNAAASFSLAQPVAPDWPRLLSAIISINIPCGSVFLAGVVQGDTQIITCLTSTVLPFEPAMFVRRFDEDAPPLKLTISTDLYEFGMNHNVTIAGAAEETTQEYSSLAYYTMNDKKERIMPTRTMKGNNLAGMRHVHGIVVAFLFNKYKGDTNDTRVTPAFLNTLKIATKFMPGPEISVVKRGVEERFHRVVSERYVTTVTNMPAVEPGPVFSFSRLIFKATAGIRITGPDVNDVMLGSGTWTSQKTEMWFETSRSMNWLTLLIALLFAFLLLIWVRFSFKSVSPTDIAGILVKDAVRRSSGTSSSTDEERPKSFYFGLTSNGEDFDFGLDRDDPEWFQADDSLDNAPVSGSRFNLFTRRTRRRTDSVCSPPPTSIDSPKTADIVREY